jgi:hypothetical protein
MATTFSVELHISLCWGGKATRIILTRYFAANGPFVAEIGEPQTLPSAAPIVFAVRKRGGGGVAQTFLALPFERVGKPQPRSIVGIIVGMAPKPRKNNYAITMP